MKITREGIAILEHDLIGRWVQEHRSINYDGVIRAVRKYIPKGGVVVDIGAYIGGHTVPYSKLVGENGLVISFEPNAEPAQCLTHNTQGIKNILVFKCAIGKDYGMCEMKQNYGNYGASHVNTTQGAVPVVPLDSVIGDLVEVGTGIERLDYIKIDTEGFELQVLKGAEKTIEKFRPVMLIEIVPSHLERYGTNMREVFDFLNRFGYRIKNVDGSQDYSGNQFDILAIPEGYVKKEEEES